MTIKIFDNAVDTEEWNQFLPTTKNNSFLFHRNFMDYHSDRFVDRSIMVYDDNKLVCIVPANIKDNVLISHQGLTYGGIILPINITLFQVIQIVYEILKYINSLNIKSFLLKVIPSFFSKYVTDDIEYILFLLQSELYGRNSAIVITYSERIDYNSNTKRQIVLGEKNGTVVKYDDDLGSFWNDVLTPNLKERFNVSPVHTLEEISMLKNYFPNNIIQVNAYLNGKISAGTTLFICGNTVHCQYISSTENGRKNGCLNFLFKTIIDEYSKNYNYFDFGIANEQNGKYLNKGLLFWKEGFGGRTQKHDIYKIDTSNYSLLERFLN